MNQAAQELFGYQSEEVVGRELAELIMPPAYRVPHRKGLARFLKTGQQKVMGEKLRLPALTRSGESIFVELIVTALKGETVPKFIGFIRDITDHQKAETALRDSELRFRQLAESINEGFWLLSIDPLQVLYVNPVFERIWNMKEEELYVDPDLRMRPIHPEDRPRVMKAFEEWVTGVRGDFHLEYRIIDQDNRIYWIEDQGAYIYNNSKELYRVCGIVRDITEQKQVEVQLRASLADKEVLFKEVHHRVKNNLQIISSLLNLQASQLEDSDIRAALVQTRDRVRAMSLLHEMLYSTANPGSIDFANYLRRLCRQLYRSLQVDAEQISLDVKVLNKSLNLERAIPCGLIVTELVSNAMKYAFLNGRSGRITVELKEDLRNQLLLKVTDDGIGLPLDWEKRSASSLGLNLVRDLSKQLQGNLTIASPQGTEVAITFPTHE